MDLILQRGPFLKALTHGVNVVEKRSTVPVLNHVLLSATQAGLTLTFTDLDMALTETLPARISIAGRICVQAHVLHDIIKKMPEGEISLTLGENDQLAIRSGRSNFNLPGLSPDEFPEITQTLLTHKFKIKSDDFVYMIDHTRFSMSTDESRYHLNGIYFHLVEESGQMNLRAVATDLHRLACVSILAPEGSMDMPNVIIGRKAINEIRRLLDEGQEMIDVGLSDSRIEINYQTGQQVVNFTARLVEGKFPDYVESITVDNYPRVEVNTRVLADAADRVSTIITDRDRALRFALENNHAKLSAYSQELGAAEEEVDIQSNLQENLNLCFNVKYVLDVANLIKDDNLNLHLRSNESAMIIKPANNNKETYVIMPLLA